MSEKIKVSYVALGAYAAFVVVSTLLVGLLPPLVNRPTCKVGTLKKASDLSFNNQHSVQKRLAEQSQRPDLFERVKNYEAKYPGKLQNSPLLKKNNLNFFKDNYQKCPEIEAVIGPEQYPWYSSRLSDYIVPSHYNLQLLVPGLNSETYDGNIDIKFKVSQSIKYVLLHSKVELARITGLKNQKGENLAVECIGEYPLYNYLIIKPKQEIKPTDGDLTLSIFFADQLSKFDSGLFRIEFENKLKQQTYVFFLIIFYFYS
jgi:hypothetical protein